MINDLGARSFVFPSFFAMFFRKPAKRFFGDSSLVIAPTLYAEKGKELLVIFSERFHREWLAVSGVNGIYF